MEQTEYLAQQQTGRQAADEPHKRGKGRPRTFDREWALQQALHLFWRQGYAPTGVAALCSVMGLNPPSLYAAFGSKANLFCEALTYCEQRHWAALARDFLAEADIHRATEQYFRAAARLLCSIEEPWAGMLTVAGVNLAEDEHDVLAAVQAVHNGVRGLFARRLERAVADGQLSSAINVADVAEALHAFWLGLALRAQQGTTSAALERVAVQAVRLLPERQTERRGGRPFFLR